MRSIAAASLLIAAACASSPTLGSGPATQTIRTAGQATGMTIVPSTGLFVTTVPFPMDQIWRVLPAVYASLGIPLTTVDSKTHTIGNEGMKLRKEIATVPLSKYIECGTTQIGPNADSYDVFMVALTQLSPGDAGTTKVTTTLDASAKPATFAQDYSRCSSKGVLEPRIVDSLLTKLRK